MRCSILACAVLAYVSCCAALVPHHEDYNKLTQAELLKLNQDLDTKIGDAEVILVQLEEQQDDLGRNISKIGEDKLKADEQRMKQRGERESMEVQLKEIRQEVQHKKDSIARLSSKIAEIRQKAKTLDDMTADLMVRVARAASGINEPSLEQVLDNNSEKWGEVPRSLYTKSRKAMEGLSFGSAAPHKTSSVGKTLLTAVVVYGGILAWLFVVYKIYVHFRGRLTVNRAIFIADATNALFWLLIFVVTLIGGSDPFEELGSRTEMFLFSLQMTLIIYYMAYVMLRVYVLAARLTLLSLIELIAVIAVGHHYYISVWVPTLIGQRSAGNTKIYIVYAVAYFGLSCMRLSAFPSVERRVVNSRLGTALRLQRSEKQRPEPEPDPGPQDSQLPTLMPLPSSYHSYTYRPS